MSAVKVLITGGSGLLGQHLNIKFFNKFNVLTLYNSNVGNCSDFSSAKIDLTNYSSVEKVFLEFRPDIIIHAAAIANPKLADELPRATIKNINVNAVKYLVDLANKYDSKFLFTSTDLVYDGNSGGKLKETGTINPLSFYAETKYEAEQYITGHSENYVILRMSLMYGFGLNHSVNHFNFIYNQLRKGETVNLYYDQYRTPLELTDATKIIFELVNKKLKNEIINIGGRERVSRYELGIILCETAGLDKNLLLKASMRENNITNCVADVSMDISKLRTLGLEPLSIYDSIKKIIS